MLTKNDSEKVRNYNLNHLKTNLPLTRLEILRFKIDQNRISIQKSHQLRLDFVDFNTPKTKEVMVSKTLLVQQATWG